MQIVVVHTYHGLIFFEANMTDEWRQMECVLETRFVRCIQNDVLLAGLYDGHDLRVDLQPFINQHHRLTNGNL